MAKRIPYNRSVFINCPFSSDYQPIFRAILFSVFACEFQPRCAREISDSSQHRLAKIEVMIRESKLGIHDISFMELDPRTKLPLFNMPFELGLFLAAKSFGAARQGRKMALILDSGDFRYREALSDISGQDIATHGGSADRAVHEVRDWLDNCRGGKRRFPAANTSMRNIGSLRANSLRHRRNTNWMRKSSLTPIFAGPWNPG